MVPHHVVPVEGDGSCFFYSMSYLMYNTVSYAHDVRASVVQHVCTNWERYEMYTLLPGGDIYRTVAEYHAHMSLRTTYATTCEIHAVAEIYQNHLVVYRGGYVTIQSDEFLDGRPIFRLNCTGPMMSAHFEPLIPQCATSPPSTVVNAAPSTSFCTYHSDEQPALDETHVNASLLSKISSTYDNSSANEKKRRKKCRLRVNNRIKRQKNRESVKKYTEKNPNVNREAVKKYVGKNPNVNREAVKKYAGKNPNVNRKAVKRYIDKNPAIHRAAVKRYNEKNPEINKESVRRYNEKRNHLVSWETKFLSGFNYDRNVDYSNDKVVCVGQKTECKWCQAKKWKEESPGLCCNNGKVQLPALEQLPVPLHNLLINDHPQSQHFLLNIRRYNRCFQMTSFGAKEIHEGNFMPTFKVEGQVYHRIGSLLPSTDKDPSFLQIYFVGNEEKEIELRHKISPTVKPWLVAQLQKMLHDHNQYVRDFKTTIESIPEGKEFKIMILAERKPSNEHRGRYNAPTTSEVALVIVGQEFGNRDIILHSRDSKLVRISETHRAYDTLQYPLMFCRGEDGYSISIPQRDPVSKAPLKKTVSASAFYSYRIMERQSQVNYLLLYRSLLNQFLVDMYAKIETERLNFLRHNQSKLRSEDYVHLRDAMCKGDGQVSKIGKAVVLPSSFTGGPRYMHERTQDAMTYVRHYGRPDLFITFTCNPRWIEIESSLQKGEKPQDRHELISRVFHLKVKKIMHLLTKGSIFGPSRCYMYTIEWQKRGLPHVHILLWLQDRIMPANIDSVIYAEIPDPNLDPLLYDIVKSTMIHGPCGNLNRKSPCMLSGSCSKRYPRPLSKDTQTADDGYPQYRRRSPSDGGFTVEINGMKIDNQWVVPYNPVLSRTFMAHINVELCNSVKSIKYICKYINKGSDQAAFGLENEWDEISKYEAGRYISSSEAAWRILRFPIHERFPPVMHLSVHLENGQRVYFTTDNATDRVHNPTKTTLLSFFELCKSDSYARHLLYSEVPAYYVWKNSMFSRRKKGKVVTCHPGVKHDQVLGRVYTVHPNNAECYYMRLLLHEVRGPTCFSDLKRVLGVVHPTYQSACRALGLLEDDAHWDHTMEEAAFSDSPSKIRELFGVLLVFCQLTDPLKLWEKHKDSLSEDLKIQMEKECPEVEAMNVVYNKCLLLLEQIVSSMSNLPLHQFGLPAPNKDENLVNVNREYLKELSYDVEQLSERVNTNVTKLNFEQSKVYFQVLNSVASDLGKLYFLDAPGGTGKTFLINLLTASIRKERKIAISVASSGIAATLLDGGKTAHSAFKLPLNLNHIETPLCNISKQSDTAHVLRECKLIVWDEVTMAHKGGLEALDKTLQDIRSIKRLMGGMTVLLAGDFRQTLPVVPRGTRADEVRACFKSSYLWTKTQVLSLRVNMRVYLKNELGAEEFSNLLLQIGDGCIHEEEGKIVIPNNLCVLVKDINSLSEIIYPDLNKQHVDNLTWLNERAILTPKNDTADTINNYLLDQLPSELVKYQSVDSVVEMEDVVHYPVEFLHTLNPPGIPPHNLCLKVGSPIMLLRNLRPPKLCNGTRLQVKALYKNVVEATIFTGCGAGETVFVPRIPLIPSDYPFQFKRLQFPIKVCFAMTINKAQGQSLKVAGVDLRNDCFSHGQLYVACSRVSSHNSLVILQPAARTKNVVYKEVL